MLEFSSPRELIFFRNCFFGPHDECQSELLIIHKIGSIPMNGHISDKPNCLPDGSGYLDTHNYPSYIRSCIDIAKPINNRKTINNRKNLVSEFNRDEEATENIPAPIIAAKPVSTASKRFSCGHKLEPSTGCVARPTTPGRYQTS